MDPNNRWYFPKDWLDNTPSRKKGIDEQRELSYRQQAANFIQDMGQRLKLSQLCINTAIVYMHRFYAFHSFSEIHRNILSLASIFLAAKIEEQPRRLELVVKVAHSLLHKDAQPLDARSDAYKEKMQEVVEHENILLQTLGFLLGIEHPHPYVVKVCQLVKASKELAQTSYVMANTSLHMTTMCLHYKPTMVACVCIHLACKWSNYMIEKCSEGKDWYYYVDRSVTLEQLESITQDFIAILETSPNPFKRKLQKEVGTVSQISSLSQTATTPKQSTPKKANVVDSTHTKSNSSIKKDDITEDIIDVHNIQEPSTPSHPAIPALPKETGSSEKRPLSSKRGVDVSNKRVKRELLPVSSSVVNTSIPVSSSITSTSIPDENLDAVVENMIDSHIIQNKKLELPYPVDKDKTKVSVSTANIKMEVKEPPINREVKSNPQIRVSSSVKSEKSNSGLSIKRDVPSPGKTKAVKNTGLDSKVDLHVKVHSVVPRKQDIVKEFSPPLEAVQSVADRKVNIPGLQLPTKAVLPIKTETPDKKQHAHVENNLVKNPDRQSVPHGNHKEVISVTDNTQVLKNIQQKSDPQTQLIRKSGLPKDHPKSALNPTVLPKSKPDNSSPSIKDKYATEKPVHAVVENGGTNQQMPVYHAKHKVSVTPNQSQNVVEKQFKQRPPAHGPLASADKKLHSRHDLHHTISHVHNKHSSVGNSQQSTTELTPVVSEPKSDANHKVHQALKIKDATDKTSRAVSRHSNSNGKSSDGHVKHGSSMSSGLVSSAEIPAANSLQSNGFNACSTKPIESHQPLASVDKSAKLSAVDKPTKLSPVDKAIKSVRENDKTPVSEHATSHPKSSSHAVPKDLNRLVINISNSKTPDANQNKPHDSVLRAKEKSTPPNKKLKITTESNERTPILKLKLPVPPYQKTPKESCSKLNGSSSKKSHSKHKSPTKYHLSTKSDSPILNVNTPEMTSEQRRPLLLRISKSALPKESGAVTKEWNSTLENGISQTPKEHRKRKRSSTSKEKGKLDFDNGEPPISIKVKIPRSVISIKSLTVKSNPA